MHALLSEHIARYLLMICAYKSTDLLEALYLAVTEGVLFVCYCLRPEIQADSIVKCVPSLLIAVDLFLGLLP